MATLKNTIINDTGAITLPGGTTDQRPASPTVGMLRYNSNTTNIELYNTLGWANITNVSTLPSVYQSATLYAQLNDNKIYSLNTLSADTVNIVAYGSYGTDEVNSSLTVLKMNGGAQTRIPQGNPGSSHTVCVWYRSNNTSNYGMLLSKYQTVDGSYGVDIWDGDAAGYIYLNQGDGYNNPYSGSSGLRFNNNAWAHFAFTFNGSTNTATMYRNGSAVGTAGTYRSFSGYTGQWSLGSWSGQYFGQYSLNNGRFYKYAVFNSSLSASDVLAIYNAGM